MIATDISQVAAKAPAVSKIIVIGHAFMRRDGDATNMKGITKASQPKRIAAKPVLMGSAPVKVAAAKAPIATGGVIIDIMPN